MARQLGVGAITYSTMERNPLERKYKVDRFTYDKLSAGNITHADLTQLLSFNDGLNGLSMNNLASLEETTQELFVKLSNDNPPEKKFSYHLNYGDYLNRFVMENKMIVPTVDVNHKSPQKISVNLGLLKDHTASPCVKQAIILVMINSRADRFYRRNGIRQTWGNGSEFNHVNKHPYAWRTLFVVGQSKNAEINNAVYRESAIYQDIIFARLDDTPHNKTLKTILGMLWAWNFCQPYFTIKGDDDIFLNSPRIFEFVNQLINKKKGGPDKLWLCNVFTRKNLSIKLAHVKRKIGKNQAKLWSIFHGNVYPPSCTGFAYLMTFDVLMEIVTAFKDIPILPFAEDVYISLLAEKKGVKPKHDQRFRTDLFKGPSIYNVSVDEIDSVFAIHGVTEMSKQRFLYALSLNGIMIKGLHAN
ncbi:uncharacterized protein TRIADDRAFT_56373 [Trichoplax adhaerens]|uniref:Hexosyltransferase n=1 Tax=Trichoplax adhaerens TaxID=10228 RepID=B3RXY5_TRIAD|nr:hypothetical protein TRIADDRAFT_56373 [Trichoplax adhaerens]EDV24940.1 hypothetical protein TRIADDRAFT_56373 [Trichoplax adhaerens]|eukprot:XP_002112830.1 hypothetical protein TRIADDRAFT_56373 [Trichoplax adhaerens]